MRALPVILGLLVSAACDLAPATRKESVPPRPLGELVLLGEPTECEHGRCYEFEVRCPDVLEPERGLLQVGDPEGSPRGVVLLTSGGAGTSLFEGRGDEPGPGSRIVDALLSSGFRTVQLAWSQGWSIGSSEGAEGMSRLACRPATVASWVYENWVDPGVAFCAAGGSGGAAQVSYMLSHYGLDDSISLAVPLAGYWMGRIDEGWLGTSCWGAAPRGRSG